MTTARALVRILGAMSDEQLHEISTQPELHYFLARFKSGPDDPLTPESMALDLLLIQRFPRSLEYYRQRAEEARWRKPQFSARAA